MNILHIYPKNNELIQRHVQLLVEGLRQSATVVVADNSKSFYQQAHDAQADIIHIHGANQMLHTKAMRCARKLNIRTVVTPHGQLQPFALELLPPQQRAAMSLVQSEFIEGAYAVITMGKMERLGFMALGWNPRVEEVHNICHLSEDTRLEHPRTDGRPHPSCPQGDYQGWYSGR